MGLGYARLRSSLLHDQFVTKFITVVVISMAEMLKKARNLKEVAKNKIVKAKWTPGNEVERLADANLEDPSALEECDSAMPIHDGTFDTTDRPTYELKCLNCTDEDYLFAVYHSPLQEMKSVAWQVARVPSSGTSPSVVSIRWSLKYGVAIAGLDSDNNLYSIVKAVTAEPGRLYIAEDKKGSIPDISDKKKYVQHIPTMISVKNNTQRALWLGITVDGSLTEVQEVFGGETMMFKEPSSFVCTVICLRNYSNFSAGHIIDAAISLGPIEVPFMDGCTKCTVEAVRIGGQYKLTANQEF